MKYFARFASSAKLQMVRTDNWHKLLAQAFLVVKERMNLHHECIPLVLSHKNSMSGLLLNCYRIHCAEQNLFSVIHSISTIHWIKVKVRFRRRPNKSNHSAKAKKSL